MGTLQVVSVGWAGCPHPGSGALDGVYLKGEKQAFPGSLIGLWVGESASLEPSMRPAGMGWLVSSRRLAPKEASAGRQKYSLLMRQGLSGEASGELSTPSGALAVSMTSAAALGRSPTIAATVM